MDVGGRVAECEFCHGQKFEPPGVRQFSIYGELHWLHPQQCWWAFEKAYEREISLAIPDAPADGHLYARQDNQWVRVPSGFSTRFEYTFDNTVTLAPNDGQMRFDNADPALATKIWLDNLDADGTDVSNFLLLVESGFIIFIQDKNDPTLAQKFIAAGTVVGPAGYVEIPVTRASGLGNLIDNQRVVMMVYGGG